MYCIPVRLLFLTEVYRKINIQQKSVAVLCQRRPVIQAQVMNSSKIRRKSKIIGQQQRTYLLTTMFRK